MNGVASGVARRVSRSVAAPRRRLPITGRGLKTVASVHSVLAFVLSALVLAPSAADAHWSGEVRGQMGFGGDEVATITYSDGSESDLKLGTYFSVLAGPIYEAWSSGPGSVEIQAMAGWSG